MSLQEWGKEFERELPSPDSVPEKYASLLSLLNIEANVLELNRTQSRLLRFNEFLRRDWKDDSPRREFAYQIQMIREALQDDLSERTVFLPSREQARFFENPKIFGEKVHVAFPSARSDIREAGKCYATDNFTACVFHLMRVAERGMRVLAKDLKVKKVGKHPLEYSEWGAICKALAAKVSQLQQAPRGPKKAAALKRYADAASQADYINEIWRKDVAHSRGAYNQPEALNVMTRVREFMLSLASWAKEPSDWSVP
jgi:hypothetical protein